MSDFESFLFLLLRKTPLILVLVGGLVFTLVRWKRHPRVSLLTLIGLLLYLLEIFVFAIVYNLLPSVVQRINLSMSGSIYTVIQLVDDFVYAGILILLIGAALSQRRSNPVSSL